MTGGHHSDGPLSSVELLTVGNPDGWSVVANMPAALAGVTGATLDNTVFMSGSNSVSHCT